MFEFDGIAKFKKFCSNLDKPEQPVEKKPEPVNHPPLRAKMFKIVKTVNGENKDVAFGLTADEAEQLISHIRRRVDRLPDNDEGKPIFEITEVHVQKETL